VQFRRNTILVLLLAVFSAAYSASADQTPAAPPASGGTRPTPRKIHQPALNPRRRRASPRLRRMHQAFVASASLKPMARQLLADRTPVAYSGVEAYARRHSREDAGALAWLVVGYAHILDHDYGKAIDSLSRAKAQAGDLGDYVSYYLASAYFDSSRIPEASALLSDFDHSYPDSLLVRDAQVLYANALLADGQAPAAAALLEKNRQPTRADVELTLGRADAALGDPGKASSVLRNLYFTMPLSGEAAQADLELKKLPAAEQLPAPTFTERKTRADLLLKGKRYDDAADVYRGLVEDADPSVRPALQLALASAQLRGGHAKDAKRTLDSIPDSTPEMNAERLFDRGELARSADDDDGFLAILGQLRQTAPASPWLEQDLLVAGNIYLLKPDPDHAIDCYRELQQRFPNASRASYAHWKVAWLSLRMGRNDEAKQGFEEQIALYPSSAEVPAALYWRARLAEEESDSAKARAYYEKLSGRYRNYYYGYLARQRLTKLTGDTDPVQYALLDHIPPISSGVSVTPDPLPTDDLRVQKAQLLENGALLDFAVRELQAAAKDNPGNWLPAESARLYQDVGRYDMALEVMKRAAPNYFAVDLPNLPRSYWEALFPKPYWIDLRRFSSSTGLDPYLVASLIRQESAFNPNAVSRKDAVGLMQLLPKTGKLVAKQVKLRHFVPTELFTPAVNLELGTRYFRDTVDKFGAFEYALAAYNAGDDRVKDWLAQGKYRDPQEFVESIPFTETREYVQAILRNANVYRQLYGAP
jgi:soluble lytic murein transglycosylase